MIRVYLQRYGAALGSTLLRLLCFIFYRWIPGHHLPPLITSLFSCYVINFTCCAYIPSSFYVSRESHTSQQQSTGRSQKTAKSLSNGHPPEISSKQKPMRQPEPFKTLLTGIPNPETPVLNFITFSVNALLLLFVLAYVYIPSFLFPAHDLSFVRLGYVSETSAKIFVREPDLQQLPISLAYRYADSLEYKVQDRGDFLRAWKTGGSIDSLTDTTDFTATITIANLYSDTRYEYALSNGNSGFFVTAPAEGTTSMRSNGKFSFLHTSCIIRNFPYNPVDHPLSIHGFKHLARWLSDIKPAFMLFLGDFIYADVPTRHGSDVKAYRKLYRQVYASPDWLSVSRTSQNAGYHGHDYDIPWIHAYDDHEIGNDWSKNTTGFFPRAFDPYLHYHLNANPPLPDYPDGFPPDLSNSSLSEIALSRQPATYTTFTQGLASFFLLDTRRYRQPPSAHKNSTMLGAQQLRALLSWVAAPPAAGVRWKILVTSVPFTKNWRVNALDTWSGYLAERRVILEAMWDYTEAAAQTEKAAGIVILSGDRHEFAATAFPPPPPDDAASGSYPWRAAAASPPIEFSTSPLSQFYLPVRTYKQDAARSLAVWALDRAVAKAARSSASLEHGEEDICLKYIPEGNSKFGVVEIESPTGSGVSVLRYRLFVDGVEAWSHLLSVGGPEVGGGAADGAKRKKEMWKEGIWE